MAKKQIFVGIDQDSVSVRGARLSMEPGAGKGAAVSWKLLGFEEVACETADPPKAIAALKKLKEKLGVQSGDFISTCIGGKQTYAVQVDVKKLPDDEMPSMLRLELRKSMPFEASQASFDYQFIPFSAEGRPKDATVPVIVSAVTNAHLGKRLNLLESAGLKPACVNVLPVAIANAFWATKPKDDGDTHVLLHIGSETCTLVIDGANSLFFNRSFSFSAAELVETKEGNSEAGAQAMLQMNVLSSEITKSITYYRSQSRGGNITTLTILGSYAVDPAFDALGTRTGFAVQTIQTAHGLHAVKPPPAGKFDVAIACAMQAMGQ
jgi:Tfp pilus assembly PilM family ATPase